MTADIQLIQSYDAAAEAWRTKIEGLGYAAAYRWLIHQTCIRADGARVLDAGCGTGDFARALVEVAGPPKRLALWDPSGAMVTRAAQSLRHLTPDIQRVQAGLEHPSPDRHDLILCAHVIEHFDDPAQALRHLKAHLAPGGQLLLVVSKPHWCNWIIWLRWRHRMIRPTALSQMAQRVGLKVTWQAGFPAGPPYRSSHAYLITHQEQDPS